MVNQSSFQQQRERLYRAGAGKYEVVQDVDPQVPGDIPLRRGMPVEGIYNYVQHAARVLVQYVISWVFQHVACMYNHGVVVNGFSVHVCPDSLLLVY